MDNNRFRRPVASLSNKNTILDILDLPAKLGRNDQTVDLYLFHESVSREHCVFECINRKYTVRDLNSTAGTFINGAKLDPGVPYHIEDGDTIKIGKIKLDFTADYEELARREQEKVYARMQEEAIRDTAAKSEPVHKKKITVVARELNEYEYDESEVVRVNCGLMQEYTPMSYTNRLSKAEVEKALNADQKKPEDLKSTQVIDIREIEAAIPAEKEEKPAEPKAADTAATTEGKTLKLSWIDDETGENKKISIETFPFRIGRKSDENDYAVLRKGFSRRHMYFEKTGDGFWVCDDGSTNGVSLNGKKIEPNKNVKVESGDSIRAGGITFSVSID